MNPAPRHGRTWAVCLLLAIAVAAAYWPALNCDFVQFDDPDYVTANPHIQNGLSWPVVAWAFRSGYAANWHPLTWLSHALDVQLFGYNPKGHHATGMAWHAVNSIFLFLLLRRLTGAHWRSAMVAGLFALHPMHVESVAWVSERKDVLSTFFWLLTVAAYAGYAERRRNQASGKSFFYGLAMFCFALGLMSKPMLVTLPFVLLLLDYWPLGRMNGAASESFSRLLLEKIPFLALAAVSSVVTFLVQKHAGVMSPLAKFPLWMRFENVPIAYGRYLSHTFWPPNLAAFYGHVRARPFWQFVLNLVLLGAITVRAFQLRKPQPWLLMGWLWFLGMLVPVIGLVQVGNQSMADRYGYVPLVGIFIMTVWGAWQVMAGWPYANRIAGVVCSLILAACAVMTARQASFWHDTVTLFVHASEVTADEYNYDTIYDLGRYWQHKGNNARAAQYYEKSLKIKPDFAQARNNLGYIYLQDGKAASAIAELEAALRAQPVYPEALYNLGRAYLKDNQFDKAIDCFQRALALDAAVPEIHFNLAEAYARQGSLPEAVAQYQRALELRPDYAAACNSLAWLLSTCPVPAYRDGPLAVALASHAEKLTGGADARIIETLAAAQAEAGNFEAANSSAARAREIAAAQNDSALVEAIETQAKQYSQRKPWRDAGQIVKDVDGK